MECKTCNYAFAGKGKVSAGILDNGVLVGPVRFLGNISSLNISASITTDKVTDYTQTGGGNCAVRSFVESSNLSMDLWNYCPENFALMAGGKSTGNTSAVIVDELHKAYVNGLTSFNELYDKDIAPVVKKGSSSLIVGTDYNLTETGIIPVDGGAISDGNDITVSYKSVSSSTIQGLTDLGKEMVLIFEGLNDTDTGGRARVMVHRYQPTPAESIPLINDEFTPVSLSGENLRDPKITTSGESQYYKIDLENV